MKSPVEEARGRIRERILLTECRPSTVLGEISGARVWLKLEQTQHSGSFKLRGVMNKLLSLSTEERRRRLVAASTGNHGAAFAHGVAELGLEGLLFLPTNASARKLEAIEASGIPYQLVGDDCVETENHAHTYAVENDCVWVSPYNDPLIVAGQGTIGPELAEQIDGLDSVLIPVGGGGLAGGIAGHLKVIYPSIEMIGCEPETSAVMAESVAAGEIVDMPSLPTLSDATAGGIEENSITFELCRDHVDRWERVSEDEIADAIRFLHNEEGMTVEGGAALGVAVMLRRPPHLVGKTVAVVITGSKIDDAVLTEILAR